MDKGKLCFAFGGPNPYVPDHQWIELRQQGADRFSVRYGGALATDLYYEAAAKDLGASIMHSAACDRLIVYGE